MKQKFPEGHFLGQGMAIGIAIGAGLGVPFSIAIGKPGMFSIGLPIGVAIGYAMGLNWEKKAKEEGRIRPLTKAEKNRKKLGVYVGIAALLIGLIALVALLLLR